MEKINIAQLLKDCPQGMELDCTIFENLEFDRIEEDNGEYYIICRVKTEFGYNVHTFTKHGCYSTQKYSKCVIYPKGKTTWEGFHRPFKDGDVVFYSNTIAIFKEWGDETLFRTYCVLHTTVSNPIYQFEISRPLFGKGIRKEARFATEEEKQKLFDAIKENGYQWNPETKTLEKLSKFKVGDRIKHKGSDLCCTLGEYSEGISAFRTNIGLSITYKDLEQWELAPNKFDITTLVPFESKVLIRNDETQKWIPAFWGYKANNGHYVTTFGTCRYCIPYEGNENLLTTNNDCDDYFKTWE